MRWAQGVLDLVWPRACGVCGGSVGAGGVHICWDCLASLHTLHPPFCSRCGDPVDGAITREYVCSFCVDKPPAFDKARSAARYRGGLRGLLHRFKYSSAVHLTVDLAMLLQSCVSVHYGREPLDAVAWVPLYPARQRARTYNQSGLLAVALARRLKLPAARGCLARTRDTETQTHLSARERAANVRGAFVVRDPEWVEGRRFLLVDDVMTTGATVNECARALKEAGAAKVFVVTVARG